jgi:hypothetical protein
MLGDYLKSAVRTLVPLIVGYLVGLPLYGQVIAALGVDSKTATERVTTATAFVLSAVYYLLVRALEQRWPSLGVFLGVPVQPNYDGSYTVTTLGAADADDWQNDMGEDAAERNAGHRPHHPPDPTSHVAGH